MQWLVLWQTLLRDAVLDGHPVMHADQRVRIETLRKRYGMQKLLALWQCVTEAEAHLRGNASYALVCDEIMLQFERM